MTALTAPADATIRTLRPTDIAVAVDLLVLTAGDDNDTGCSTS
ncbi:hypothetical protein [Micromonospora sp. U21]|nr:hypothetical protein [Micromonospora sp. U21]